jgi:signal transduction histidine kinase
MPSSSCDWEYLSDTDRQTALSAVDVQSRHLGQLVTDLVDAARNRLGAAVLDRAEVSLPGIVQQAIATLPEAHRGQVSMGAPQQLMVDADPRRLLQILLNLLTNAARYGNGKILVVVERAETAARIMVHDNGPGVPKKFESVIWERFERGAHRFDSLIPGSGIGLPIARALVEAHGGTIGQHRSAILGGACFSFTMPLADAAAGLARAGLRLGDMSVVTVSPPLRAGAVPVAAARPLAGAEAAA